MEKFMFMLVLFAVVLFTNSSKYKTKKNIITQYEFRLTSIDAINLTEFAVHLNDEEGDWNDALETLVMEADSTAEVLDLVDQILNTDLTRQLFGNDFVDKFFDVDLQGQSLKDTLLGLGLNDTLQEELLNGTSLMELLNESSLDLLLNGALLNQLLNETSKGQLTDEDLESYDFRMLKDLKQTYQESKQYQFIYPVTLDNLFTTLQEFQTNHCLLVIDNWQSVDIKQTSAIPYILRTLDLALYHRKFMMEYYDFWISAEMYDEFDIWDTMLLPKRFIFEHKIFSKLDSESNQYHNCPVSKFYSPLLPDKRKSTFCVDLNHAIFASRSKLWQCEIQVNLFMPKRLLEVQNFPGLFQYESELNVLPSSRPKLHIFLDFKRKNQQDLNDLREWISNSKGGYSSQNHAHISGQVVCSASRIINSFDFSCNIRTISYIDYCLKYSAVLPSTLLNHLSFQEIKWMDRDRLNNLYSGRFYSNIQVNKQFSLSIQVPEFEINEPEAITHPLKYLHKIKTKYADNIQILAFAYNSVLKNMLGNVTRKSAPTNGLPRFMVVDETLHDDYNVALSVENKFGSLRFVSCGARGIQKFQIEQFLSVFETNIWKWLLAFAALLLVTMNLLRGNVYSRNVLEKFTCLLKVMLEQGDPFPGRFVKSESFRFLICGTLIGGLVLSNAFKSNNVYNIVMPKQLLKFSTIDELLERGYALYTQLIDGHYFMFYLGLGLLPTKARYDWDEEKETNKLSVYDSRGNHLFYGLTEIQFYVSLYDGVPENLNKREISSLLFVKNVSKPHLGLHDTIVEPFKILTPLFQVGLIDIASAMGAVETIDFWTKQDKFIAEDLKKCNKSAWILPSYRAQQLTRMLYQSERHSDVGVTEYFKTKFNLIFYGPLSSPLLQRTSRVSSSGLLKWWSDLINRTDLVKQRENVRPVKPTMSGNIQTIFYMLLSGLLVAQTFLVLELHGYILKKFKAAVCVCGFALRLVTSKMFLKIRLIKEYFSCSKVQRFKNNTIGVK